MTQNHKGPPNRGRAVRTGLQQQVMPTSPSRLTVPAWLERIALALDEVSEQLAKCYDSRLPAAGAAAPTPTPQRGAKSTT